MNTILQTINWPALFTAIWTIICIPLLKYFCSYMESKQLGKYSDILYEEVTKVVKCMQESIVTDIKGTSLWTKGKQEEVKNLAKDKIIEALSSTGYKILSQANEDFD